MVNHTQWDVVMKKANTRLKPTRLNISTADKQVLTHSTSCCYSLSGKLIATLVTQFKKTTKKWIPAAVGAEEGRSEGQRLSVILGETGKSLACSIQQNKALGLDGARKAVFVQTGAGG